MPTNPILLATQHSPFEIIAIFLFLGAVLGANVVGFVLLFRRKSLEGKVAEKFHNELDTRGSVESEPSSTTPHNYLPNKGKCLCCGASEHVRKTTFWAAKRRFVHQNAIYLVDVHNGVAWICETCGSKETLPAASIGIPFIMTLFGVPLLLWLAFNGLSLIITRDGRVESTTSLAPLLILISIGIVSAFVSIRVTRWIRKPKPFYAMAALRTQVGRLSRDGYRFFGSGTLERTPERVYSVSNGETHAIFDADLKHSRLPSSELRQILADQK